MQFIKRLLRYNFWFEHDVVGIGSEKYLERWFMYFLGFTIRLHKFYRGDDDRAPHDHPWAFITFPLTGYFEQVFHDPEYDIAVPFIRYVQSWRFHYRPSNYAHIVLGCHFTPAYGDRPRSFQTVWPFYTIVLTSRKQRSWGFWPEIDAGGTTGTVRRMFVPWRIFNAGR